MRLWAYLSANLLGYFWLPCPICGRNFGGNEKGNGYLMINHMGGKTTCNRKECVAEGDRRSQELMIYYQKNYHMEDGRLVPNA